MSTLTLGQRAIGQHDGDTLELANQWARVTITTLEHQVGDGVGRSYMVEGDLLEPRETRKEFRTVGAAINYAMQSLAVYQEGRA